mgnify:CR=1 FL=1
MNEIPNEYLDQQRWLMNNGLFTDNTKDTLFLYGSIVNKGITALELSIDSENKRISYTLYASPSLIKAYNRYQELKNSSSLWDMWKLKRLLKTNGNLELKQILSAFVTAYCGPGWATEMILKKSSEYEDQGSKVIDGERKDR